MGDARLGHVFFRASQVGQVCGIVGILAAGLLGSVSYNLPLLVAGALMFALGIVAMLLMRETAFHPLETAEEASRNTWRATRETLRRSARLVRGSPVILTLLAVAAFYGMSSEGFDRLSDAHILLDIHLPPLGTFNPVIWFSIIMIAVELLGIAANEVTRRRVNMQHHVAVARSLFVINALLLAGMALFALANSFALAVGAYLLARMMRRAHQPIYMAWLTQTIDARVRATVLSISSQLDALGQIAGGPVIGVIGNLRSIRAALLAASVMLTPALLLYARATRLKIVPPGETNDTSDTSDTGAAIVTEEVTGG
jgi:DHA3 family tetracycline resistance protein-like MFS transporter